MKLKTETYFENKLPPEDNEVRNNLFYQHCSNTLESVQISGDAYEKCKFKRNFFL